MSYRISPDRTYFWRALDDRRDLVLEDASMTDLCTGTYLLRQVDIRHEEIQQLETPSIIADGFELISLISFSSMNKRQLTLYLDLSRDVPFLNYETRAEYSVNGGETWKTSSQLNRKATRDTRGLGSSKYLLNLPKSASNREEVRVRIYERIPEPEEVPSHQKLMVKASFLESKVSSQVEVEIKGDEAMKIKSTVSNEVDGMDGYILLDITGGKPPYFVSWDDGSLSKQRRRLAQGKYHVSVLDVMGCRQEVEFEILPPDGTGSAKEFKLNPLRQLGLFELEIAGLYRQPMELVISNLQEGEVKRFQINPLYQDLIMELDLSFLGSGNYSATLLTSGFSKKTQIFID